MAKMGLPHKSIVCLFLPEVLKRQSSQARVLSLTRLKKRVWVLGNINDNLSNHWQMACVSLSIS